MSVSEDSSASEFEEFARTRLTLPSGEPSFAPRVPELRLNVSSSPTPASPLSQSSPSPSSSLLSSASPKHTTPSSSSSSSSGHAYAHQGHALPTASVSSPSLSSFPSSSASTPNFSALSSSASSSSFHQPTRRGSSWIGQKTSQTPLVSPRTPSSSSSSWFTPIIALLSPRWLEEDTEADTKAATAAAAASPRGDAVSPRVTPRLPEPGQTFTYFDGVSWAAKMGSSDGIPIRLAIGENVSIFSPTGELMFTFQLRKIRQYGTKGRTFLVEHHQDNNEMRWIYVLSQSDIEAHTMKATLRHAIQSAASQNPPQ